MKSTALLLSILMLSCFAQAKNDSTYYKHEIGLSFMNYERSIFDNYCKERYLLIAFAKTKGQNECRFIQPDFHSYPTLFYSYQFRRLTKMRFSFSHAYSTYSAWNVYGANTLYNYKEYRTSVTWGLQFNLLEAQKTFVPYFATELYITDFRNQYEILQPPNVIEEGRRSLKNKGGLRISFGANIRVRRFSIAAETAVETFSAYPLSRLSLNYHF